jgi:hypothetical protein
MIKRILFFMLLTSIASATDILLTWDLPTEREDGSKIESIDRFNLYQTIGNVLQGVVEIPAGATSFQLSEVETGIHTFAISIVELGQEGALSNPISVNVTDKVIAKAGKMILTIQVVE